jgi:archaemetzincin
MNSNRRDLLRLGLLCGGSAFIGWKLHAANAEDESVPGYRRMMENIRPLFTKKKAPGADDWLANQKEPGQTFDAYRASDPNRPTPKRTKIYLQAIGNFPKEQTEAIAALRRFMHILFGLEVKFLPELGLEKIPAIAQRWNRNTGQRQLLSTHILFQLLKPNRPDDAVAVLAITNEDLWPGDGWNFVFGQASLDDRVGVWSTARMGDPAGDAQLFLRRVLQVASHETAHMLGIKHCIAYECCMNGANHQGESDRAPLVFCAECDAKLWWANQLDAPKRALELHAFATENQLADDAQQWQRIATALGAE